MSTARTEDPHVSMAELGVRNVAARVLIAGGGTGGHVYPGIAIAKEIQRRRPDTVILFVGTDRGLETRIVPAEGFRLETITVSGLKGKSGVRQLKSLFEIPASLWQCRRILAAFKPSVVVGVGGYASGPPLLLAALRGIPTLIQEQNALPGLTNRLLARFVNKVATAFAESERYFGSKAVLTGNPVRPEFKGLPRREEQESFTILIFGGSQGARAINQAMMGALPLLAGQFSELRFVHQTGDKDYDEVSASYRASGVSHEVRPFFYDIPAQYARANLIICRAGATTLAETSVSGRAALLIPFARASDNHQQKNAEALVRAGAAEMILEKDLTPQLLANRILFLKSRPHELRSMEEKSRGLGRPDSTERIVDLVENLMHV
ncbi:MAG: undecaprenyldiphospho-muramoylpentapeptide beta-N-acetylglucosaminyltransferase [Acidobacteriota bacterium]